MEWSYLCKHRIEIAQSHLLGADPKTRKRGGGAFAPPAVFTFWPVSWPWWSCFHHIQNIDILQELIDHQQDHAEVLGGQLGQMVVDSFDQFFIFGHGILPPV